MDKTFRDAFIEHLQDTGVSVASVARKSGVSLGQLRKLKQRRVASTNAEDAVKVAASFGETIDEFMGYSEPITYPDSEFFDLYLQLSETEQALLAGAAKGLIAHRRQHFIAIATSPSRS